MEQHDWSSGLCDYSKDGESCWWGTWCCWLLSARNEETFDVGSSFRHSCTFVTIFALTFLLVFMSPVFGILCLIIAALLYSCYKARVRSRIRQQLNIQGSFVDDIVIHTCCACCAVAQEAREAKHLDKKKIDFCCGQEIDASNEVPVPGVICDEALIAEDNNILNHLKYLSKTSRLLLGVGIGLLCIVPVATGQSSSTIIILGLVFVQPLLILYFFYWQSRRKHVFLDYVVKLFVCGFCVATTQSMILEAVLQSIIGFALVVVLFITDPSALSTPPDPTTNSTIAATTEFVQHMFQSGAANHHSYPVHDGHSVLLVDQYLDSAQSFSGGHTPSYRSLLDSSDNSTMSSLIPFSSETARKHVVLAVVGLLLMAYVVAAGVEESMKHAVVRFCRFPSPLKNPDAVLVYMMTAALGFATAENIEYVLGSSGSGQASPLPGSSLFVGELFVLALRVLMPVHVICSVLQATSLSRVLFGQSSMNTFMVLLPAMFLHGSFDFILFFLGFLEYAYGIDSLAFGVVSFVTPIVVTVGGLVWAWKGFSKVVVAFESWQPLNMNETEDHEMTVMDSNL